MSQETVTSDVTASENRDGFDEQFDKYFKSQGQDPAFKEEISIKDEVVEVKAPKNKEAKPKKKEAVSIPDEIEDEDKPSTDNKPKSDGQERNYRGMAHEERQRRQEVQARLENVLKEKEEMQRAIQEIRQRQYEAQQQQQQQQIPSFDENPLENIRYTQEQLNAQVRAQQEYLAREQQARQYQAQEQQFVGEYARQVKQFADEKQKDMPEAYVYLQQKLVQEYQAMGIKDPNEAMARIRQEEKAVVARAMLDGVNPGERIYDYARAKGYVPKSAVVEENNPTNPHVELLSQANDKLAKIERGLSASRSLANSNSAPTSSLTLSQIANLPSDEYYKYTSDPKNWEAINRKLSSSR